MQTRTTFHLTISRPALALARVRAYVAQRDPILLFAPIIVSTLIGLILGVQIYRALTPAHTTATQPTALPAIMIIQTARAVALPTPLPTAAPRLIRAYDAPNGSAFPDTIPVPDPAQWIARWGDGWIEVTWQPHSVWIRTADLGANLADVQPVPQAVSAPVVAPVPAEQQYQVNSVPPAEIPASPGYYGSPEELSSRAEHVAQQIAFCDANPQNASCIASPPSMENP